MQFGALPTELADLLVFYLLAEVFRDNPPDEEFRCDIESLQQMARLNPRDALLLQQVQEKKAQLESMISNVMKAGQETNNTILQNLRP